MEDEAEVHHGPEELVEARPAHSPASVREKSIGPEHCGKGPSVWLVRRAMTQKREHSWVARMPNHQCWWGPGTGKPFGRMQGKDEEKGSRGCEKGQRRQKEEDEQEIVRRAKKRSAEVEADDSERAVVETPSSSRGPDADEASPKRKGGEQGARDIEDVLKEMEEETSGTVGPRRMDLIAVLVLSLPSSSSSCAVT